MTRSLYAYVNRGADASGSGRSLHAYLNRGVEPLTVPGRAVYPYLNRGVEPLTVEGRSLHAYEDGIPVESMSVVIIS